MSYGQAIDGRQRLWSAIGVLILHALLALALLRLSGPVPTAADSPALATFDATEPALPDVAVDPVPAADPRAEGAAAAPAAEAVAAPIVAPPARIELPSPVVAAPVAGPGSESTAGAAPVPGPGTGGGGQGDGTGSGRGGDGQGSGGGAVRAQRIEGAIVDRDYPSGARRDRAEGSVEARFTVDPEGRVRDCTVTRSSGHADLDEATCRLIERRFRYRPARDPSGAPVAETRGWRQQWWLERRDDAN